jgi:hypothetical protein
MARRVPNLPPATSLVTNAYSAGGSSITNMLTNRGVKVASGVGTGGTLATLLTVTGAGYVPFLLAYSNSAVPTHTVRCQVIIDGVTAFDATSDSIASTANRGMVVVDAVHSGVSNGIPSGLPLRFNASLVVKVASSQSGTDYAAISYELQKT